MKQIKDFEVIKHGIMSSQYFQGCGVSYTKFDEVYTGIGDNPKEAFDDCLEQMAMNDIETKSLEEHLEKTEEKPSVEEYLAEELGLSEEELAEHESSYFLSIRIKV